MHIRIAGPPPAAPPLGPQTLNGVRRIGSTHRSAPQTVAASCQVVTKTHVRQLPVSPAPHNHRGAPLAPGLNPHSARRTTCDHLPRLRALALLRRRPHTRADRPSLRRPRNLHTNGLMHRSKVRKIKGGNSVLCDTTGRLAKGAITTCPCRSAFQPHRRSRPNP